MAPHTRAAARKNQSRTLKARRVGPKRQKGLGLLNWVINNLPFELHLPSYNYCGPGTRLKTRLARGDKGVNELDELCKQHDLFYNKYKSVAERGKADKTLLEGALKISHSNNSSVGLVQRTLAKGVAAVMRLKLKYGI